MGCPNSASNWWTGVYRNEAIRERAQPFDVIRSGGTLRKSTSVMVKNLVQSFSLRFSDETAAGARQGMSEFGQRSVDRRLQKRGDMRTCAVLQSDPINRNDMRTGHVFERLHAAERW